jgi:drug/metabolite transporter (DMT)-like permease
MLLNASDAYTITWYRFAFSVLVLGVLLGATRRLPDLRGLGAKSWMLLLIALLGLLGNYVFYLLALDHVSPTVNQTVIQLAPLFMLTGGLVIYREHFVRLQWLGLCVLLPGLLLFFNRRLPELLDLRQGLGLGVLLLLIAAIVWAAYALAQKALLKALSSQQILWLLYVAAIVLLLPMSDVASVRHLTGLQIWLLFFSCMNTLVAYGAFAEAMEHWEVSRVGAVLSLSPLFTLGGMWLMRVLAPGSIEPEHINAASVVGALFVVAGSALIALGGHTTSPAGDT